MLDLAHKKLDVWRKSVELVSGVYSLTDGFPKEETFGLVSQMRRASVSVASNIAEGASRPTQADRRRFYVIARSSVVEVDTQKEICRNLNYLNNENSTEVARLLNDVFAMLSGLIGKSDK